MQKSIFFILCVIALSTIVEANPSPCGQWWCGQAGGGNNGGNGGGCGGGGCGGGTTNNIGNGQGNTNTVHMNG
ncbi:jg26489 [Pararge aegeria aegeria]|uniref:Jg26489 protein n=1 Tax=Pararge aegeria aegeria TaxID=348720 RepID=A0A8S4S4G8_9NEOP|nr:jg26489 [Pararge aegeria aegeria]